MRNTIFLFIAISLLLTSCGKDSAGVSATGRVIIVNEGGFNHARETSISVYDPAKKTVYNNVFDLQNGFSMGNVAQSLYLIGDTAYTILNNSARIVIADAADNFKYIDTIGIPGSSPRYFQKLDDHKAYLTDLYANKIWIINYRTKAVTGSISVTGWTEQMVSYSGKIYVLEKTAPGGSSVHKLVMIDPITDRISNSIDFATDPSSMALTDQGKLYVITSTETSPAVVNASLYIIDLTSFTIAKKIDFAASQSPGAICFSSFSNKLLYADNGIYTMAQTDTVLPQTTFITSNNWNIYVLNADPSNGDIYISDAIDYQQASKVMRYSKDGTLIDAFNAGIITNGFVFRQ